MSFFDQVYAQLFPNKAKSDNSILVQEPIRRSEQYWQQYTSWAKSFDRINLINKIYNSYVLKKQGIIGDPDVHILSSKTSNGFAVALNTNLNKQEATYLLDWMASKILELDYKKMNSDITVTDKEDSVQTLSKHYLKPRNKPSQTGKQIDQQYGNVLIELTLTDDQPNYLKFVANTYSDHKYKEPLAFEKLAEFLFDKN